MSLVDEPESELISLLVDSILWSTSIFGRLWAISSLYSKQRNLYEHQLAGLYGAKDVDIALRKLHTDIFNSWISLTMRLQTADLKICLAQLADRASIIQGLQTIVVGLVPPATLAVERDTFLQDISWIQALLTQDDY
jgi:hypothetical protein